MAMSMILWILVACASPSAPPKIRKSWAYTKTVRPWTVPQPVMTPSVYGLFASRPKPVARCRRSGSTSLNDPSSRSSSIRSRAVSFPLAFCASVAFSLGPRRTSSRIA